MLYKISLTSLDSPTPLSVSFNGSNGYLLPFDLPRESRDIIQPLFTKQISPSVQSEIAHLLQLERETVQQRKALLANYRVQFNKDIQPLIASLPGSYPEIFI